MEFCDRGWAGGEREAHGCGDWESTRMDWMEEIYPEKASGHTPAMGKALPRLPCSQREFLPLQPPLEEDGWDGRRFFPALLSQMCSSCSPALGRSRVTAPPKSPARSPDSPAAAFLQPAPISEGWDSPARKNMEKQPLKSSDVTPERFKAQHCQRRSPAINSTFINAAHPPEDGN